MNSENRMMGSAITFVAVFIMVVLVNNRLREHQTEVSDSLQRLLYSCEKTEKILDDRSTGSLTTQKDTGDFPGNGWYQVAFYSACGIDVSVGDLRMRETMPVLVQNWEQWNAFGVVEQEFREEEGKLLKYLYVHIIANRRYDSESDCKNSM